MDELTLMNIKEFLIEQFKTNKLFSGGVLLGAITTIVYSLKVIPLYLWDRIKRKIYYTVTIEKHNRLYTEFETWLKNNHESSYRNTKAFLENTLDEYGRVNWYVGYNQLEDFFFLRRHGRYIKIEKNREKLENSQDTSNPYYETIVVSSIFGKKAINKLLEEVREYNKRLDEEKTSVSIYNFFEGRWELTDNIEVKDIENVFINEKDEIIKDIQNFINSKQWYKERSIPYKRGYGFFGTPGNGKTTLSMAIAKYFDKDIYILNLNEVSDTSLKRAFQDLSVNSILLLEDIDTMFESEREIKGKKNLSFTTLLNCIDGAFYKEGLITIMTTNHPEKLDHALTRNGRIDMEITINNPTFELAEKYLSKFYDKEIKFNLPEEDYKKYLKHSMVDIQELCLNNFNNSDIVKKEILEKEYSKESV